MLGSRFMNSHQKKTKFNYQVILENAPERIYNVSKTQLSVARFYAGCKINGIDYHYDAASDTLTRIDAWKRRCAFSKDEAEKITNIESSQQLELFI